MKMVSAIQRKGTNLSNENKLSRTNLQIFCNAVCNIFTSLILQRKIAFFAIIIAICNVECPTLSYTVHSKLREKNLFGVG